MVEGNNPEQLVTDLEIESGDMESMGGGEPTDGGGGMSGGGNLGGLMNSDPHNPIGDYEGISMSFKDGSKYLERGIDKMSGWPAILDIGIGGTMMLVSKAKGPEKDKGETEKEGGDGVDPDDITQKLAEEGKA